MEISPKMAMSEVDKPRACPYCKNDIHTFYSDGRCKCNYCDREFYVLRYAETIKFDTNYDLPMGEYVCISKLENDEIKMREQAMLEQRNQATNLASAKKITKYFNPRTNRYEYTVEENGSRKFLTFEDGYVKGYEDAMKQLKGGEDQTNDERKMPQM